MWGHKKRRIADLEFEVAQLRAEARRTRHARREDERTHGFVRQHLATSASDAHTEADRYRDAWLAARARAVRHRDDATQQQRLADHLMAQLLDLPDRADAARAVLGLPERAEKEATEP